MASGAIGREKEPYFVSKAYSPTVATIFEQGRAKGRAEGRQDISAITESLLQDRRLREFSQLRADPEQRARIVEAALIGIGVRSDEVRSLLTHAILRAVEEAPDRTISKQPQAPLEGRERWALRADLREKPQDFIRRVYGDRLGRGLTQADIRRVDGQLYQALHNWLRKNALTIELPTRTEAVDKKLSLFGLQGIGKSAKRDSARATELARLTRALNQRLIRTKVAS